MTCFIETFMTEDYPEVLKVWEATDMGRPERGDTLETIRRCNRQGGILYVLRPEQNGPVIGTSWITCDGRRLYLHHFGILPEWQGKKLSHPLLEKSLLFAREQKMQIKLEVHRSNRKALNLYAGAGFSYLGDYLVYIIREIE